MTVCCLSTMSDDETEVLYTNDNPSNNKQPRDTPKALQCVQAPLPLLPENIRLIITCHECNQTLRSPVMWPKCGHTTHCASCAQNTRPRCCPTCNAQLRGVKIPLLPRNNKVAELIYNLASVYSMPESEQEMAADLHIVDLHAEPLSDMLCCNNISSMTAHAVRLQCTHALSDGYIVKASAVIRKHYRLGKPGSALTCHCGLVCIPKKAQKRTQDGENRFFYGCPAFHPMARKVDAVEAKAVCGPQVKTTNIEQECDQEKPKIYCNFYKWMSKQQIKDFA